MQPFVAVLPPLVTDPPRDTECTDVPNGPQVQTYLARGRAGRTRAGGTRLLMVTGRQDPESWPQTLPMIDATTGDPHVSHIVFPTGGHNLTNYRAYLGPALKWAHLPAP